MIAYKLTNNHFGGWRTILFSLILFMGLISLSHATTWIVPSGVVKTFNK